MMQQTALTFGLEKTKVTMTAHADFIFWEVTDRCLPEPGNSVGYRPSEFTLQLHKKHDKV
ncbi:MAG: hypothetical protein COS92_06010 [Desulfobacterales bacterium CG07_land_8_20_14_0_80_52_14]|nr:MAG: hypothetical protein COS92_06010 [Desulfobacterales bacterium CG07_land_8_20_14_0_80_52_14]